jgi:hypothetical protein
MHTTTLIAVSAHEKSVVRMGEKWFVRFGGIFSDTDAVWASYSPNGGLGTEQEAIALMADNTELVRRYL